MSRNYYWLYGWSKQYDGPTDRDYEPEVEPEFAPDPEFAGMAWETICERLNWIENWYREQMWLEQQRQDEFWREQERGWYRDCD